MSKTTKTQSATAKPICEVCGLHEATSISYFKRSAFCHTDGWKLACQCTADEEYYYVYIDDFFKSELSRRNWIDHLSQKNWFDLANFMQAVEKCGGAK